MLLTIAIATYNQEHSLKLTLDSLLPQISNKSVEILILDDSSNDLTKDLVEAYDNVNIHYHHGTKRSLDHADFWLIKNSKSKYVWWFGDDEFLEGAISAIFKILELEPDFVWVNSMGTLKAKDLGASRWMSGNEIIEDIGDMLTFLSALVWRREFLLKELWRGNHKLGNCMAYMYPQLECLSKNGKYYYIDKPLFYTAERDFSKLWYNPFFVFSKNYFEALDSFLDKENIRDSLIKEKNRRGKQILLGVLRYRLDGKNYGLGLASFKDILSVYYKWPIFWKLAPLFLIPKSLSRIIGKFV